ncbi:MAG: right-handed parallel beta-helix repeat-containing protein, partial [bacterium]
MESLKRVLGFGMVLGMVFGAGAGYGAGSVTVYNAGGSFNCATDTIQLGVNACPVGGTVSVSAGTYTEAVYINEGIALIGSGTPVIDPSVAGSGVTFDGNGADNAIISGFKITGATDGIDCINGADPRLANNLISGNSSHGIYCNSSSPSI